MTIILNQNLIAMEKKLNVMELVTQGVTIGLKNFLSLLGALILYLITIWIPYLNVGTTIAMASLPIELSKGNIMNPTAIFDAKYRKFMGDFFILQGLKTMAMIPAMLFLIIPAYVLGISWSLSVYLLLDKGMSPMQALTASNRHTYGNKWRIFFGLLILVVCFMIVSALLGLVAELLSALAALLFVPIILGAYAYIYRTLVLEVGAITEAPAEE